MAFDASPSWSGFNYQGKVALYYALSFINKKIEAEDFSNYSLMLEDTEDFEIKRNRVAVSIHQVKAYNSSSYNDYSDALLGIVLELYKQPSVLGKIHTWKPINSKPNYADLKASLRHDMSEIIKDFDNSDPKDEGTILAKAASTATKIPKKAAILRLAFKDFSAPQLRDILKAIVTRDNNALERLDCYVYDDGNAYCDLNEINSKLKSEMAKYWDKKGTVNTDEKKDKTFYYFLGMMDSYIIDRHKTKRDQEKIQLEFSDIVSSLECDREDIGSFYLAFKFKEKFAALIDDYMEDSCNYSEPEDGLVCNLKEARKFLLSLNPDELWEYYRSFSPQSSLHHECNTENALEVSTEGIRHVLIEVFHKLNIEKVVQKGSPYKFIYRANSSPGQSFLPTTITSAVPRSYTAKQIVKNHNMIEALYEVGYLICGGSEKYVFSPDSMTNTTAPQAEDEDRRSKRDEVLKNITLVPIVYAKGVLD
ncbi:ABC-three component system protein [Vreelandella lutescens]|uniref:ABC-three component systems C-terminal domain-containing protein n=1 Tax=Vreelandella lutescens TaxID=1602943 RepID=A0ABQ1P378_9GAMM|nr:ABC-three component system protein [Halomonas lutescens]GGC89470.1 hypothetical protein GCM10011382_19690 [Halomonas lutescens]